MLARYKMYRGSRPPDDPLPVGVRKDTRKHTRHCLRPTPEIVETFLDSLTDKTWAAFEKAYLKVLRDRLKQDPKPFEDLARQAQEEDVYLGCSCPTGKNTNPAHCHTILALRFMKNKFPDIKVNFPSGVGP